MRLRGPDSEDRAPDNVGPDRPIRRSRLVGTANRGPAIENADKVLSNSLGNLRGFQMGVPDDDPDVRIYMPTPPTPPVAPSASRRFMRIVAPAAPPAPVAPVAPTAPAAPRSEITI